MTLKLTFEGETLGAILPKIRQFLDDLPSEGAVQGLVNLDGPLPPAVKRAPKEGPGAKPTPEQIAAAINAEAPPCTREEVAEAARAYVAKHGAAGLPALVGYPNLNAIPEAELWRAKRALEKAVNA